MRKAKIGVAFALVVAMMVPTVLVPATNQAFALPNPINFQRSIPFDVFNSTTPTLYDLETEQTAPFEISIINDLTYKVQSGSNTNNKAVVKFQQAKTGTFNALELHLFEDGAIDVVWTDGETGSSTKIAGQLAEDATQFPKELLIENQATKLTITDVTNENVIVDQFVLPNDFQILTVAAFGETDAMGSDFATIYIGDINPSKLVSVNTNDMMPLIMAIVTISVVVGIFAKLGKKI